MRILILLVLFITASSCKEDSTVYLNIATSANVQYAMNEIVAEFENTYDINCHIISSSSGKLTAQIKEGAAYDIFMSANLMYPEYLFNEGLTEQEPIVYALGALVLWTMSEDIALGFETLNSERIDHIAIANPATAPYGAAAKEVLNKLGLYDSLKNKLVFGESISQVNQFINSGAAQIGFTSKSVVLSPRLEQAGRWISIDSTLHQPISQGMVSLIHGKSTKENKSKFMTFMKSSEAKKILEAYGYSLTED